MVKTPGNPGGLPREVLDNLQDAARCNRAQFYYDLLAGPFYGFKPAGRESAGTADLEMSFEGVMGTPKPHYDGIVAFSPPDFPEDLKRIDVPVLVMYREDDQIVLSLTRVRSPRSS